MNSQCAYDRWKTTTPADSWHKEECNCDECHEGHIESGMVEQMARHIDYECCRNEIEKREREATR